MTVDGRDISELNGPLPASWFGGLGFVIVRAFNERGRLDKRLDQYLAASAGVTARGVYGWPIAGDDNHTLGRALGFIGRDLELPAWADYELGGRARLPDVRELEDYCRGIESAGCRAGWYSNRTDYRTSPVLDTYPWWYANPSHNPAPREPAIVQYGEVGGVDADRCTDAWFARLSTTAPQPTPEDAEMPVVIFGQSSPNVPVAYLVLGGRAIATWTAGPYAFGCPAGGVDYVKGHEGTPLVLVTPADLARVIVP